MKKVYPIMALLVLLGSMAVAAQAQSASRTELRASIPFPFNAGDKTMAAGEYRIRTISNDSSNVVVKIEDLEGKSSVMLHMSATERKTNESSNLVFNRYGNRYYFAATLVKGEPTRLAAAKSKGERATEREFAALKIARETVVATARR